MNSLCLTFRDRTLTAIYQNVKHCGAEIEQIVFSKAQTKEAYIGIMSELHRFYVECPDKTIPVEDFINKAEQRYKDSADFHLSSVEELLKSINGRIERWKAIEDQEEDRQREKDSDEESNKLTQ